eukprot:UN27304
MGYYNLKPLFVRNDGKKYLRWYGEAWYLDDEIRNEAKGIAKLEEDIPHPFAKAKSKWMMYDDGHWKKSSKVQVLAVAFTETEIPNQRLSQTNIKTEKKKKG